MPGQEHCPVSRAARLPLCRTSNLTPPLTQPCIPGSLSGRLGLGQCKQPAGQADVLTKALGWFPDSASVSPIENGADRISGNAVQAQNNPDMSILENRSCLPVLG